MRGKLRDKRAANKKEVYSREGIERRHPYKRDSRALRIGQQDMEEFDLTLELEVYEDEGDEESEVQLPYKK